MRCEWQTPGSMELATGAMALSEVSVDGDGSRRNQTAFLLKIACVEGRDEASVLVF